MMTDKEFYDSVVMKLMDRADFAGRWDEVAGNLLKQRQARFVNKDERPPRTKAPGGAK